MEKINIAEILKDCPQGMELDCALYENLEFDRIEECSDNFIVCRVKTEFGYNVHTFTKHGCYSTHEYSKCVIYPKGKTTWEGFVPPCNFKDGDILVHSQNQRFIMSIYHNAITELVIKTHCILWDKEEGLSVNKQICCYADSTRLATEEEKEKLFQAIKDNGYKWNSETKTLEKLVIDKFDITTLKPFDKVLTRTTNSDVWGAELFGFYKDGWFLCNGHIGFRQCIPYKENEHLLGTTNDCDEFYKTW